MIMRNDIERYLNEEMPIAERDAFEAAMAADPKLAEEVAQYRGLLGHLRTQLLREKMMSALNKKGPSKRSLIRERKFWIIILGLLIGALAVAYWSLEPAPVPTEQLPGPGEPDPLQSLPEPPSVAEPPAAEPPPAVTPNGPIAQSAEEPLPPGSPSVRGAHPPTSPDSQDWAIWLEDLPLIQGEFPAEIMEVTQSIAADDFSAAYVRLQLLRRPPPPSDTLLLLKAYCLLELGEGMAAATQLDQLPSQHQWTEEADWYRTLALLLQGKTDEALQMVDRIRSIQGHAFQRQAASLRQHLE